MTSFLSTSAQPSSVWSDTAEFFGHPFVLLVIGALLTGLFVPFITRRWQDRQKELELKTNLVADMSQSVHTFTMTLLFEGRRRRLHSAVETSEPLIRRTELEAAYQDWRVRSAVIGAKLEAYFRDASLRDEWSSFTRAVNDFYRLEDTDAKGQEELYERLWGTLLPPSTQVAAESELVYELPAEEDKDWRRAKDAIHQRLLGLIEKVLRLRISFSSRARNLPAPAQHPATDTLQTPSRKPSYARGDMRSLFRRYPWTLFGTVLIVVFVVGVTLALIGVVKSPTPRDEFWSDLAKAGLQIAIITVLGAIVTTTLKYVDERRARDEQRLQVFRDIIAAYNRVKAVRRNLRGLGVLAPANSLNAMQAKAFREQMMALNDAQLSLEAVKKELAESRLFKDPTAMIAQLRTVEHYLGGTVYKRWEESGGGIWEGADTEALRDVKLVEFAGHKHEGYRAFEEKVSKPLDDLTRLLHAELFGAPKRSTRG